METFDVYVPASGAFVYALEAESLEEARRILAETPTAELWRKLDFRRDYVEADDDFKSAWIDED